MVPSRQQTSFSLFSAAYFLLRSFVIVILFAAFLPSSWSSLSSQAFSLFAPFSMNTRCPHSRESRTTGIWTLTASNSGDTSTSTASIYSGDRSPALGAPICEYHQVTIPTSKVGVLLPTQDVSVEDITPTLKELLNSSGMKHGSVTVISRHTTTAITINEREQRLARDMAAFLLQLAPPDERSESPLKRAGQRYYHNDIDQRPDGEEEAQRCRENGWDIDNPDRLQAWRDQEPINAHSHLLSMLLGSSESIPVVKGEMVIGQWQSVLLVDLDGPRDRTVGIQLMGFK